MKKQFYMLLVLLILVVTRTFAATDEFPLRKEYPGVPTISLEELRAQYNDVFIVDVRSAFEFDVIHILKAVNILVSNKAFAKNIEAIRPKEGAQKIVFYCNGFHCAKSYDATQEAIKAGFKNVFVFDAGIFDWAKDQPDKAVLLGKSPVDPAKLISKEALKAKMISYAQLKEKEGKVAIIDIRDSVQRDFIPKITGLRHIPLDRLKTLLAEGKFKAEEVVFIDAVGKQVNWLQYYLQYHGYEKYSFLENGMEAFAKK